MELTVPYLADPWPVRPRLHAIDGPSVGYKPMWVHRAGVPFRYV